MLEGALEDPDHNRGLMKAAKNVDRMATLVEDLDIVIEGGFLELDMEEFNLGDLVQDILEELEPCAKRNNIDMEFLEENRGAVHGHRGRPQGGPGPHQPHLEQPPLRQGGRDHTGSVL